MRPIPMTIQAVRVPYLPRWYGLPFVLFGMERRMVPGQFAMRSTFRVFLPCRWLLEPPAPN